MPGVVIYEEAVRVRAKTDTRYDLAGTIVIKTGHQLPGAYETSHRRVRCHRTRGYAKKNANKCDALDQLPAPLIGALSAA
jgi:hypothetical protein